ncbi:hypothetical protein NIES4074_52500 [Cylindrospermum sp. NIES-4074]|nr:hypothetical protein NIES4074_52500 [Cylindrospermum sp. NIES-4074]
MSQAIRESCALLKSSICIASGAIALSVSVTLPSQALTASYSGDTSIIGTPTFNRPETEGYEGGTNPPTSLSINGTNVRYSSQAFFVDATGSYDVVGSQQFLGIQFLYQTSFNPATPLANLLSGADSFPEEVITGESTSGFSGLSLTANNQYFLVTTGFDETANSFGTFTNTIIGPGNITLGSTSAQVPFHPSTNIGTVALGIFGGSLILKRKLKKSKSVN